MDEVRAEYERVQQLLREGLDIISSVIITDNNHPLVSHEIVLHRVIFMNLLKKLFLGLSAIGTTFYLLLDTKYALFPETISIWPIVTTMINVYNASEKLVSAIQTNEIYDGDARIADVKATAASVGQLLSLARIIGVPDKNSSNLASNAKDISIALREVMEYYKQIEVVPVPGPSIQSEHTRYLINDQYTILKLEAEQVNTQEDIQILVLYQIEITVPKRSSVLC